MLICWISIKISCLTNSINQIENCAKIMRKYNSPKRTQKQQLLQNCSTLLKTQLLTPKTPINPIIIHPQALACEGESESVGQQQGKYKIEQLCKFFMDNIASKQNYDFEARQLIENTGVKQRRIYDLMNILEGCGFIKRTAKGKYTWFGFDHKVMESQLIPYKLKDTTSLRNLAFKVKDLLFSNQGYIDIKDIFLRIQEKNKLNQDYNPKSIKRRVYQCCKILKALGVIDKKGHKYKWMSSEERKNIKQEQEIQRVNQVVQSREKNQEGFQQGIFKNDKQSCLVTLVKNINSQQDLQQLILDIRRQYQKQHSQNIRPQLHPKRLFK